MHCTNITTLAKLSPKMHPLKPFSLLLLLLSLSIQPLANANTQNLKGFNIQQVTLQNNNYSLVYEYDNDEDMVSCTEPFTIESEIIAAKFTYLMKIGVKTYNSDDDYVDTYVTLDTGSDFIWLQGKTCKPVQGNPCYCDPKIKACIEKPKKPIDCMDINCKKLEKFHIKHECSQESNNGLCKYSDIHYGDDATTEGILGQANFLFSAFGKSETDHDIKLMKIGFSTKNEGEYESTSLGMVGLGFGELSFIKQYTKIKSPRFSYYLPQFNHQNKKNIKARSKFRFGHDVKISDTLSTPLLTKNDMENFDDCDIRYCVHLKSISLKFKDEGEVSKNIISVSDTYKVMMIDSGTTFTYLSENIFDQFLEKIKDGLNEKFPKKFEDYENCFEKNDDNVEKLEKISFEFSGTTIELKRDNFFDEFTPTSNNDGDQKINYLCLTVKKENEKYHQRLRNYGKSNVKPHLLGSRAQMDFLVAFDLFKDKKVSFEDKNTKESNQHIEEFCPFRIRICIHLVRLKYCLYSHVSQV